MVLFPSYGSGQAGDTHGTFGGHSHLNLKMFLQSIKTFSCSAFCADTAVLSTGVTGVLQTVNIPQNYKIVEDVLRNKLEQVVHLVVTKQSTWISFP